MDDVTLQLHCPYVHRQLQLNVKLEGTIPVASIFADRDVIRALRDMDVDLRLCRSLSVIDNQYHALGPSVLLHAVDMHHYLFRSRCSD